MDGWASLQALAMACSFAAPSTLLDSLPLIFVLLICNCLFLALIRRGFLFAGRLLLVKVGQRSGAAVAGDKCGNAPSHRRHDYRSFLARLMLAARVLPRVGAAGIATGIPTGGA